MLKYKKFVFDKSLKLFNTINLAYIIKVKIRIH